MLQSIAEEVQKQEHSYGNTQIMLDPWSSAALSLNAARGLIQDAHLEGTGKDVDPNHITVRFGLLNDDVDALRAFLASQTPFEVSVGGIELFPISEHSDGAVPVVARMEGPGLHALEAAIGDYADFTEKSFPVYKPHCTLAYCKPEEAAQYASLPVAGTCVVHAVTISHASGVKETIPFGLVNKWDASKHPREPGGSSRGGEFTETLHGARDALDSLLAGEKNVSIDRNDVRRFLEHAGDQHEDPDLTDLQVEGMLIFGGNGLGLPRDQMPQIPKEHREGLLKYIKEAGITVEKAMVNPLDLKPTQKEISARNVAEKLDKYEEGKREFPRVLVAKNGRILDGHHHWGMMAAHVLENPKAKIPIYRFNATTKTMLALMHAYMKIHGLKRKSISDKWDESQHPREKTTGRWTEAYWVGRMREALPVAKGFGQLPQPKFILPDGTLLTSGGGIHSEAAKKAGAPNLETVLKDGVMRIVVQQGKVMAFSIGSPVTSKQIQTVVDNAHQTQYGELAVAAGVPDTEGELVYDSRVFSGHSLKAGVIEQWVNKHYTTKKKDPISGRYVTPFVSFDKQGDEQLRMIASLNSSRLATWGFTAEAEVLGMARYRLTAVLDGRTSKFCRFIDGKIFEVGDAREKVIEALNVQDPNDLRVVQPWPKQDKASMAAFAEMSADELVARGLHIPPYHPHCRTLCRSVESSKGKTTEMTPEVPAEAEVFQAVTAEDLRELGVEATPEQVAEWNANIGMSPTELLSKLTGMPPQEVLTKGKGVGAAPVRFDDAGIGIRVRGEDPNGVEFKLNALLDPFTGIFYLTQAELLAGTPKAELKFVKNLFAELINVGVKSSATELAVGVAGNAAYFAKLGFLPDDIEWDGIRLFAQAEIESGTLKVVMESLAPADALLVKQLLQDKSASALTALVELPFMYEGRTIGEWILGETGGMWALNLADELLLNQAKAYLS